MKTLYIVPTFHYDVAYLRPYDEYLGLSCDIIDTALDLLAAQPDYHFMVEQVILLREYWNRFPLRRGALRRFADSGRLSVGPGMYVMPDLNHCDGESLYVQAQVGREWLQRTLGIAPRVCWIADCWGHHAQLPQILRQCGYDYYVFWRCMRRDVKRADFLWRGLDGTTIKTHWLARGYAGLSFPDVGDKANALEMAFSDSDRASIEAAADDLAQFGAGGDVLICNGGDFRRPQATAVPGVQACNANSVRYRATLAAPTAYLDSVDWSAAATGVVDGEFNSAFQGSFTTNIGLKQAVRRQVNHLRAIETLAVATGIPRDTLGWWEPLLFHQFHDIICGTICDAALHDAYAALSRSQSALYALAADVDTAAAEAAAGAGLGGVAAGAVAAGAVAAGAVAAGAVAAGAVAAGGGPAFAAPGSGAAPAAEAAGAYLFNSLSFARTERIALSGREYVVRLPAFGNAAACATDAVTTGGTAVISLPTTFEGDHYRAAIDAQGYITGLWAVEPGARNGTDAGRRESANLVGGSQLPQAVAFGAITLQMDYGDSWINFEAPLSGGSLESALTQNQPDPLFRSIAGTLADRRTFLPQITAVRAERDSHGGVCIHQHGRLQFWRIAVEFETRTRLDRWARTVEYRTNVLPSGKHYRLRAAFPTAVAELAAAGAVPTRIDYEIPFGIQQREPGEHVAQTWIDYHVANSTGADGAHSVNAGPGVALLNRGIPANNVDTDTGTMLLTLFRAVDMDYKTASAAGLCEGIRQTFEYAIMPHNGGPDARVAIIRAAHAFNTPLLPIAYPAVVPLRVSAANVMVSAMRWSGGDIFLRLYEAAGRPHTPCTIDLPATVRSVTPTDGLARPNAPALPIVHAADGRPRVDLEFGCFEIKNLRIRPASR